jgi:galactokinase/mevalonate kinase-like predicted kinase
VLPLTLSCKSIPALFRANLLWGLHFNLNFSQIINDVIIYKRESKFGIQSGMVKGNGSQCFIWFLAAFGMGIKIKE